MKVFDNVEEIKKYIDSYSEVNDIIWNIRGIMRYKDSSCGIYGVDLDIFNKFIKTSKDLSYNLFQQYCNLIPNIRIYFNPNPIYLPYLKYYLDKFNIFEDYNLPFSTERLTSILLENNVYFEKSKILLDIDVPDTIEKIENILNTNFQIILKVRTMQGYHILLNNLTVLEFIKLKKLFPENEFPEITFKKNYNLCLLYHGF